MKEIHIPLLKSFDDLPFNIGKKTLIDYIKGNINKTIDRNKLCDLNSYGSLFKLNEEEVENLIDKLIESGYLEIEIIDGKYQVIKRTKQGLKEIYEKNFEYNPNELPIKKSKLPFQFEKISEKDKELFSKLPLDKELNDEQKKAVIEPAKEILCIAGAGSGKTRVLTKRIQFLIKFRGIKPEKILAITFTRKAREEMEKRLEEMGIKTNIETFNSFSEKILRKHANKIYGNEEFKVAMYRDKISIIRKIANEIGFDLETISDDYFNKKQLREKSKDELFFLFINDLFSILDFYKHKEKEIPRFYEIETDRTKRRIGQKIYEIVSKIDKEMKKRKLRDFTDQIIDTNKLFKENKELIPNFEHILIDEFQDINNIQFKLIELLKKNSLFAVGDPRQAIYGWRGSDIKHILKFKEKYEDAKILSLSKNYRSDPRIVEAFNSCIQGMGLENLEAKKEKSQEDVLFLIEHEKEELEKIFLAEAIIASKSKREEIFILARTNRILEGFAQHLEKRGIKYAIRSEETYKTDETAKEGEVLLATVHSIKGMEANEVYLISANTLSYPNKVQDNFILSLIKGEEDYDKYAEELRLFYVAMSRAKKKLVITYTGNPSKFISDEIKMLAKEKKSQKNLFETISKDKFQIKNGNEKILVNLLKEWRMRKSKDSSLPSYMILSNNSIEEIAMKRPRNKDELMQISGLGPMKIAKYSDDILKILNG